jgi:hypothetical protein
LKQVTQEFMDNLISANLNYTFPSVAELRERGVDFEILKQEQLAETQIRTPYLCVLDTEFFFSAFQYQLKHNGSAPRSLQITKIGKIRLFVAEKTFVELIDKLPEFAAKLDTKPELLAEFLIRYWLSWLKLVKLPEESIDSRVSTIATRDSSDRPAAHLASLLSPCLLLTKDSDFEALLGVLKPVDYGEVVQAIVEHDEAMSQAQAIELLSLLPISATIEGIKWISTRLQVSPWMVGGIICFFGIWVYRSQKEEVRGKIRKIATQVGYQFMLTFAEAETKLMNARRKLQERLVLPKQYRTHEEIILRELAVSNDALSAQKLWNRLDAESRPSVKVVRELLRTHPSTQGYKGGIWTFGYRLINLI